MRIPRRGAPVALTLLLSLTSSSCLWTHRVIVRGGKRVTPGAAPPLKSSSLPDLLTRITNLYNAIQSFQATVDMTPSVGSVYKGQINEGSGLIKDVTSYILFRKPDSIRIIGKAPVVRTTEFDMVSTGDAFRVYLVSKNLFVEGSNSAPTDSKSVLENLRPEHFLSAMLIHPAENGETPILQDMTDEENALYLVQFIRKAPDDSLMIGRTVWFDRLNLSIVRQIAFNESGEIVSDTRYSKWEPHSNVMFPSSIDINRPKDGYGVAMQVLDIKMNIPLTDQQFVLSQPEGSTLRHIGESKTAATGAPK